MRTIAEFAAKYRQWLVIFGVVLLAAVHFPELHSASDRGKLAILQSAWATYRIETIIRLEQGRELTENLELLRDMTNSPPEKQLRLTVSNLTVRAGEIIDGLGVFAFDLQNTLRKRDAERVRNLVGPLQTELTGEIQPDYLRLIKAGTTSELRSGTQALIEHLLSFETKVNSAGSAMESLSLQREPELFGGSAAYETVSSAFFVIGLLLTFVSGWFRLDLPATGSG